MRDKRYQHGHEIVQWLVAMGVARPMPAPVPSAATLNARARAFWSDPALAGQSGLGVFVHGQQFDSFHAFVWQSAAAARNTAEGRRLGRNRHTTDHADKERVREWYAANPDAHHGNKSEAARLIETANIVPGRPFKTIRNWLIENK